MIRSFAALLMAGCILTGVLHGGEAVWKSADAADFGRSVEEYGLSESTVLEVSGGTIHVGLASGKLPVSKDTILQWIDNAARAVSLYHGRYPVDKVKIVVIPSGSGTTAHGVTYGGKLIRLNLGSRATAKTLSHDWVLTHEMLHLGFPDLDESHRWMEEGMAVYLEPIARVGTHNLSVEEMWRGLVEGLPEGLPQKGDLGLDRTHTWGRTYWGGTLFWLLADIEIREQTHNKYSVRDVIRTIRESGGNNTRRWAIEKVLETGDRATGTKVLSTLYGEMALESKTTDLSAMWKKLGVSVGSDGKITFDNEAPLADIRIAITAEK